jgi:hypothetical protein
MRKILMLVICLLSNSVSAKGLDGYYLGASLHQSKQSAIDLNRSSRGVAHHLIIGKSVNHFLGLEFGYSFLKKKMNNLHFDLVGKLPIDEANTAFLALGYGSHSKSSKILERRNSFCPRISFGYDKRMSESWSIRAHFSHQHTDHGARRLTSGGAGILYHL